MTVVADEADDLPLIYLRRLDAKMDRIIDGLADVEVRSTNLGEGQAVMNRRMDRPEGHVERIERCLDLVDMPH